MNTVHKVWDAILAFLFKGYSRRIREMHHNLFEDYKSTLGVKDLIRERLKGIKPNNPEDNTVLQNYLNSLDNNERLAFLSKAHEIVKNKTFRIVVESQIIESEHKAMVQAEDMNQVNFNRATINGLMLIEEELIGLSGMYQEEKDGLEKLTEQERTSVI